MCAAITCQLICKQVRNSIDKVQTSGKTSGIDRRSHLHTIVPCMTTQFLMAWGWKLPEGKQKIPLVNYVAINFWSNSWRKINSLFIKTFLMKNESAKWKWVQNFPWKIQCRRVKMIYWRMILIRSIFHFYIKCFQPWEW